MPWQTFRRDIRSVPFCDSNLDTPTSHLRVIDAWIGLTLLRGPAPFSFLPDAGAPRCREPLGVSSSFRGSPSVSGVPRCQFIFSRSPSGSPSVSVHLFGSPSEAPRCRSPSVSVHLFGSPSVSGAPRCQFIFSGKNDELTPDFRARHSRVYSSTTLSHLRLRPSLVRSKIKSHVHTSSLPRDGRRWQAFRSCPCSRCGLGWAGG